MSALPVSGIIFILTSGGILLGALLRRTLPKHHLNEHARDVVRLGVGLIAAIAALVLGLLIGAAKSSFETQNTQVKQITANLILLDSILAQYGPEALPIRQHMRKAVGPFADRLWREKQVARPVPLKPMPRRNRFTRKFRSWHRTMMSSVRYTGTRRKSVMISHRPASCCLPNPKIGFRHRFSQFWHFGS